MLNYRGYTITYKKPNHYEVSRLGKQSWTVDSIAEAKADIDENEGRMEMKTHEFVHEIWYTDNYRTFQLADGRELSLSEFNKYYKEKASKNHSIIIFIDLTEKEKERVMKHMFVSHK